MIWSFYSEQIQWSALRLSAASDVCVRHLMQLIAQDYIEFQRIVTILYSFLISLMYATYPT